MSFFEIQEKKVDDGKTYFTAIASTASVDRHEEVVDPNGWDIKNFKKNGVILWAHNHTIPAIGKATKVWVEGTGKRAKLMFDGFLHGVGEMGSLAKYLVDEGIINSFSVGFKAIEYNDDTFTKQELLEISLVNVPANPDAQIAAIKAAEKFGATDLAVVGIDKAKVEMEQRIFNLEQEIKSLVKASKGVNPTIIQEQKIALSKVIARASDKMLEDKQPSDSRDLAKVVKRANETLNKLIKES